MEALGAVRVVGPWRDISGYARMRRDLALALHRLGVPVQLADSKARSQVVGDDPLLAELAGLERPLAARFALHVNLPEMVTPEPGLVNLLWTQFEADRIPAHWVAPSLACDLVLVPSRSSWEAWAAAGVPSERLRLLPLGVRPEPFLAPVADTALLATPVRGRPLGSYGTRVLNVSDIGRGFRKNLGGLLAVWFAATNRDDDALLVLKWSDSGGPRTVARYFEAASRAAAALVGKGPEAAAPVHLVTANYREEDLPGLYAACTHYLSVSSGEGWDLPMTEAGASGLRLIAPGHSGYRAYLNETIATLLPWHLVPAAVGDGDRWLRRLHVGANWWETDLDAAAAAVRDAVARRDRHLPTARETILREFSWERAAERLLAILAEFEAGRGTTPAATAAPARAVEAQPSAPEPAVAARLVPSLAPAPAPEERADPEPGPEPLADPEAASDHARLIGDLLALELDWGLGAGNWERLPDLHLRVAPLQRDLVAGTRVLRRHDIGVPPAAPRLTVVVPLYRNLDHLGTQLAALRGDGDGPLELLYVLDGPEGEREALAALRAHAGRLDVPCRLLVTNRNAGFGTTSNLGAAEARAEHLLLLNSDAWPERPGWLAPLLAAADRPWAGLVQPLVVGTDGVLQSAGQTYQQGTAFGLWNWEPILSSDGDAPAVVPGAYGAALLLRREVWERLGGFSGDYVVGQFEDVEASNRARQAGLLNMVVPAVTFRHAGGASYGGPGRGRKWLYNAWLHHERWWGMLNREAEWPESETYLGLLRALHAILAPERYLEIGVQYGRSLSLARCRAVGVDPDPKPEAHEVAWMTGAEVVTATSDDFFASDLARSLAGTVDLAFIDGDHAFPQALRDFFNAERLCRREGVIVLHDPIPGSAEQAVPEYRPGLCMGDVWKMVDVLAAYRPDLSMDLVSAADAPPSGLLVVTNLDPSSRVLADAYDAIIASDRAAPGPYENRVNAYLATLRTTPAATVLNRLRGMAAVT